MLGSIHRDIFSESLKYIGSSLDTGGVSNSTAVVTPLSPRGAGIYRRSPSTIWLIHFENTGGTSNSNSYIITIYDNISVIIDYINIYVYETKDDIRISVYHTADSSDSCNSDDTPMYDRSENVTITHGVYTEDIILTDGHIIGFEMYPDNENPNDTTIFLTPKC